MYKKVYLEITNICNLHCPFCIHNHRLEQFMDFLTFKKILHELQGYTKYLYLHVLGEPLMHPDINQFIDYAHDNFFINITTNGYLIKRIKDNQNIRQINISLHSFDEENGINLSEYMNNIFEVIDNLPKTYISFRLWTINDYTEKILNLLNCHYGTHLEKEKLKDNTKLAHNVYLSIHDEFVWPNMHDAKIDTKGTCLALKNHIGILVDGTIVPCCLDADGVMSLGNILTDNLEDVIKSERYQNMYRGFQNQQLVEPLCQRCTFRKNK